MDQRDALDEPALVTAIDGEVAIDGPGRMAGSLTPDAADETARRLHAQASDARAQAVSPKQNTPVAKT
jgi:hypothetical protein